MTVTADISAAPPAKRWGVRGTAGATIAARLSFEAVSHSYSGLPAVRSSVRRSGSVMSIGCRPGSKPRTSRGIAQLSRWSWLARELLA